MPVAQQDFRAAMARLGAAVNVITTLHDGIQDGFTASAVCSVTDEPATLLVCINRTSRSRPRFNAYGSVCVNVLASDQQDVSNMFSGKLDPEQKFTVGAWTTLHTGAPVLLGAVASFDCTIANIVEVGTHSVLFCEVQATVVGEHPQGLMYLNRAYHPLPYDISSPAVRP